MNDLAPSSVRTSWWLYPHTTMYTCDPPQANIPPATTKVGITRRVLPPSPNLPHVFLPQTQSSPGSVTAAARFARRFRNTTGKLPNAAKPRLLGSAV